MINVDFADVKTVMSEMGMAMMGTGRASGEDRAREAAEKAIQSPLLDDIDLQGARGILVNITAGLDLSLGEFSEVGDTIEEFASEEATVVIGTVIDPDMHDEIKVTVVATGLSKVGVDKKPISVVKPVAVESSGEMKPDYRNFDRPTIKRRQAEVEGNTARQLPDIEEGGDYFDIPAFLRRQAD
jgi:cell division protein FtsZ